MIRVAIVTVVLNDAVGLRRTLDSVVKQQGVILEIVVIDGGSVDGTRDVMEQYSGFISRKVSEPDEGIFHAMDKGLSFVNSDWVIFMNAGDCFASSSVLCDLALESAREYAVVYGSQKKAGKRVDPHPVGPATHAGTIFACHQAMCFNRRQLGSSLHYHHAYKIYADFELIARLYREGFRFKERDLIVVDFEGCGISSRVSWLKRIEKYRALRLNFGWIAIFAGIRNRLFRKW